MDYKTGLRRYKIAKSLNNTIDKEFEKVYLWVKENMIGLNRFESIESNFVFMGIDKYNITMLYSPDSERGLVFIDKSLWDYFDENMLNTKHITEDIMRNSFSDKNIQTTRILINSYMSQINASTLKQII